MPETDPIDIKFLINSDEVKKMADEVISSVRGVTKDAEGQSAQFTAQLDGFFKKLMTTLKGAFSDVKLDALAAQLDGVDDAGKRFQITLNFLKENLADLKLNPQEAKEFAQGIEDLSTASNTASAAVSDIGADAEETFNTAGLSVQELEEKLQKLIRQEEVLRNSIRNTYDPALLAQYDDGLKTIIARQADVAAQLEKMAESTPSGPREQPGNAFAENAESMKAQADQARLLQGAMRGVFGAMTSAMLATQMLTGQNKRYTETFTTLISVYAVVRGAVTAYKNIQEVSNLVTSLSGSLFKGQAAAATASAVATGAQAAATEGAATATVALNTAIKANPIGLILTAIVALTTALVTYIKSAETAAETQKKLNDALLRSHQLLSQVFDLMNVGRREAIDNAAAEVSLAQARGASETEVLDLKTKQLQAERDLLNAQKGQNLAVVQNLDNNRAVLQELLLQEKSLSSRPDLSDDDKKRLEALKSRAAELQYQVDLGEEITKGIRDNTAAMNENAAATEQARKEEAKRAAEAAKANNELARRNAVAAAEARTAAATEGTAEWLAAELAAIDTREKADIASARAAGETIVKIQQDAANARRDAEQKFNQTQLADRISAINAQLAAVKKGSLEEMQLRIDAIRAQSEAELTQIGISAARRAEIEAKTEKEINDIRQQYNDSVSQSALKARESDINAQLAAVRKGSADELNLRKQLLELRTLMEVQQAEKTISNEEELQAKISEIYAKNLAERGRLQEEFFARSLQDQLDAIDRAFDAQKKAVENQSGNSPIGNRVMRDNQEILAIQIEINRERERQAVLQKTFNQAAAAGGDSLKRWNAEMAASVQSTTALENRLKVIKNQKLLDQFAQAAQDLGMLSAGLNDLGASLADVNEGMADTISTVGQLAGAAGDVMAGLASGNLVGMIAGVIKGVSAVINIFTAARKSEQEALEKLREHQEELKKNELEYIQLMRERARTQEDITKSTVAELNARKEMLSTQKAQAQADFDALLARIQLEGQQVIGEHTKKYGGFLGVGRKTKVVQDFADVTGLDFDELEKLFTEGRLDEQTAKWFEQLQKVRTEIEGIADAAVDAEEQMKQVLTGTTSDSIADSIIRGFEDGKTAVEDFADDFETLMKQAILSSIQVNALKKPLENFYNQFSAMAESGGKLDMNEIQSLQSQYNSIIENAGKQFDQLKELTGISFDLQNQPGLSGAISRTITEDTANELAGLARGQFDYIKRSYQSVADGLIVTRKIEANTANLVVTMNGALVELQKITVNTRDTNQSVRDLGL